jgi:hypothetical protein
MSEIDKNYWLVGSMLGGTKKGDIFNDCIERGYWYGWEPDSEDDLSPKIDEMRNLIRTMKTGDRVAIKKMMGSGENAPNITIRAIGIVKVVDLNEWRVYVDWLLPQKCDIGNEIGRIVPKKGPGAISTISGPFKNNEVNKEWLPAIFCI